jgi:hypothetical protein
MTAKKRVAASKKAVSKTAFIKSLAPSMPAKQVVEKAKAEGIKLSVAYVYSIRASAKKNSGASKNGGRPAASTGRRAGNVAEHDFIRHAFAIGFERASHLLASVKSLLGK